MQERKGQLVTFSGVVAVAWYGRVWYGGGGVVAVVWYGGSSL